MSTTASAILGARERLRTPLYRNGFALAVNSTVSSLLGAGYWYVATHHATQATVGQAGALVAALVGLSTISQLSLPGVLTTFLPRTHRTARRLVLRAYGLASLLGVLLGGAFALVSPHISSSFAPLAGPIPAIVFTASVATWCIFGLQDNALTGLRRAVWVPIENTIYSATKLAALTALGVGVGAMGLFATWVTPALIAVFPVSGVLLLKLLPMHARTGDSEDLGGLRPYLAGDSVGLILSQLSTTLLPVLVVVRLGPQSAGAFAVAWMLTQSLDLVAINLGMSLTVEGAHNVGGLPGMLHGLRQKTLWLVGAAVAGGVLFAPQVMALFGPSYAAQATPVLRLLLLGCLGRVVNTLALCASRARRQPSRIIAIQLALALTIPTTAWLLAGPLGLVGVGIAWAGGQSIVGLGSLLTERGPRRSTARTRPVRTILYANHWHDDNKGDSAISGATISLLRERWPTAEIRVATLSEPHGTIASGQLRHIRAIHPIAEGHSLAPTEHGSARTHELGAPRAAAYWLLRLVPLFVELAVGRPRKATRRRLADIDLVVLAGGSNIYDNPAVRAPMSLARLMQVCYPAWAAGRLQIPVVLAGHTLGPFPRRSGRALARRMLGSASRTVLREPISLQAAADLGLANVCVAPDLAFATQARRSPRVQSALAALPAPSTNTLGLVVRQHPHRGPEADERTVETFAAVARHALETSRASAVLIVVQAQGPTGIEDDRPLSAVLARRLSGLPVHVLDDDFAPDELAALYGSCAAVVAVRLHAAILALSQGTPAFAVAYMTRKTEGVMSTAGLPDAWCSFDEATPERIIAAFSRLFDPETRVQLNARRSQWLAQLSNAVALPGDDTEDYPGPPRRPAASSSVMPMTSGARPAHAS